MARLNSFSFFYVHLAAEIFCINSLQDLHKEFYCCAKEISETESH